MKYLILRETEEFVYAFGKANTIDEAVKRAAGYLQDSKTNEVVICEYTPVRKLTKEIQVMFKEESI